MHCFLAPIRIDLVVRFVLRGAIQMSCALFHVPRPQTAVVKIELCQHSKENALNIMELKRIDSVMIEALKFCKDDMVRFKFRGL